MKAVLAVTGFILGLGWGAYGMVQAVAQAQAGVVESKMMAIRDADFEHINGRFDRMDSKLDRITTLLEEK